MSVFGFPNDHFVFQLLKRKNTKIKTKQEKINFSGQWRKYQRKRQEILRPSKEFLLLKRYYNLILNQLLTFSTKNAINGCMSTKNVHKI